jgi:uncharacterized membrane protein YbaN (DUF454 family)
LVLGIIGIVLSWFPAALLGIPLALVGLILGILARKNAQETQQPTGMATGGLVVSIIGMILGILFSVTCVACFQKFQRESQQLAKDPEFQRKMKELQDENNKALEEARKAQEQQQQAAPATPPPSEPTKK